MSTILDAMPMGPLDQRVDALNKVVSTISLERFGEKPPMVKKAPAPKMSRRQSKIADAKKEKNILRKQHRNAKEDEKDQLNERFKLAKKKHQALLRAEKAAKARKEKRLQKKKFLKDPFKYTKNLFVHKTSGRLSVEKSELESYLNNVYSDDKRNEELPYLKGLVRPTEPGVEFDMKALKIDEVERFLKKARSASAPGPNGIQYRVYKKCPLLRKHLFKILKTAWNKKNSAKTWSTAEGIFIPKINDAEAIGDFRVIAKTNVEGKIFFGVIARRLTDFLLDNGYVDTTVQKAGIPGFPGCLEHSAMIWDVIQAAREEKKISLWYG